ncbi:MAG TPA: hypothetical protein VK456_04885 [Xanthobacteraceae bacterium]|nr:hypothetical protein [Xanthobacteraceae bacterium]
MSVRSVGAWRSAFNLDKWLNYQGAAAQQDTSLNNAANSAFATAQTNYFQNSATLTAQAVLKREQAAAQTQTAALQTLLNEANSAGGTGSSGSSGSSVNILA